MKKTFHISLFLITDFFAALISWLFFFSIRKELLGEDQESLLQPVLWVNASIVGLFWVGVYFFAGLYKDVFRRSRTRETFLLTAINLLGVIVIFFTLLLDDEGISEYTGYYKTFGVYFGIHTFFIVFARVSVITYLKSQIRKKKLVFNTIIVGAEKSAADIFNEICQNHTDLGFRFIGYLQVEGTDSVMPKGLRNFGSYHYLPKVIRRCYIDQVIIAVESEEYPHIQNILNLLSDYKVKIGIIPDVYQILLGSVKVNQLFGFPFIEINQDLIPQWQKVIKRALDIFASFMVLLLGLPFYLLFALLTRLSSPGPVFYSQERVGKDGKPFKIYKFRSMKIDAEENGPALASTADQRITDWGRIMRRFRLDELPQFYNILKGDMSLVGPRPERAFFIEQILKVAPEYRHLQKVRPGLTSLGQVKFGYAENVDEMVKRLKYDIFYIENMSLAMDFRILLYTVLIIIQGRGK